MLVVSTSGATCPGSSEPGSVPPFEPPFPLPPVPLLPSPVEPPPGWRAQSFAEPSYGPQGLALMREGRPAGAALESLVAEDPHPELRQVAMVDADGRAAAHTGAGCVAAAGHRVATGISGQANMVEAPAVPTQHAVCNNSAQKAPRRATHAPRCESHPPKARC